MKRIAGFFRSQLAFWLVLLGAMMVKYFPYGIQYFKYQDDNNQYGNYWWILHQGGSGWSDIILRNQSYSNRPLAAILDVYLITPLWEHLWIVLAVMVVLHFATVVLLDRILERSGVPWGRAASLTFGLWPMLAEASYWISSSSRIVVGMFFSVAAVYCLLVSAGQSAAKPLLRWAGFGAGCLLGLLAQGFYEQVIAFHLFFGVGILLLNRKSIRGWYIHIVVPLQFAAIAGYYYGFRNVGFLSVRGKMLEGGLLAALSRVLNQIKDIFITEELPALDYTLRKGFTAIWRQNPGLLLLLTALALAFGAFLYFEKRDKHIPNKVSHHLLWWISGAALFLVPFGPFFLLSGQYLYLRNIYISVAAIALLGGLVWRYLALHRVARGVCSILMAGVMLLYLGTNVMEVNGFRLSEKANLQVGQSLLDIVEKTDRPHEQVIVFNTKYQYYELPAPHFQSATIEGWSFTGLLEAISGEIHHAPGGPYVFPIMYGNLYTFTLRSDAYILAAVDDQTFEVKEVELDGDLVRFKEDGRILGHFEHDESVENGWRFYKN